MKKLLVSLFILLSTLSYSQESFRYDTIRVSKDDARNIHHYQQSRSGVAKQNQQRRRMQSQAPIATGFDARKLRFGLNLGLSLSNHYNLLRFAPQVGYQFNQYVMTGIGVSYYHSKRKYNYGSDRTTHTNNSVGANAFAYLYPTSFIALSAQPELNYIWKSSKDMEGSYNKTDVLVPSVIIGAGLRLGNTHAMIYYDVVQDANSPYTSGVFYGVSLYF